MSDRIAVEEVNEVPSPPRATVDDARETFERKRDYLQGFLAQKPQSDAPGEPGGEVYEAIITALKEIYDPEIPVNIYELGLIYGVEVTPDGHAAVTMTLTTPHCPVAESMPPQPEIVSHVTSASPSAIPPTTLRPRMTTSAGLVATVAISSASLPSARCRPRRCIPASFRTSLRCP